MPEAQRELFILRSVPHVYDYLTVWAGTCFDEHVLPSTEVRPPKGHCCRRVSTSNKPAAEPLRQPVAAPRPRTHRCTASAFGMSPHTRSNANGFSRVDSWRNAHYYCKFECKNNAWFFWIKTPVLGRLFADLGNGRPHTFIGCRTFRCMGELETNAGFLDQVSGAGHRK